MLNTSNDQRKLLPNFDQLFATTAQAPGGVARLRELILTLAVQGKLVTQDANDEPASELLKKIRVEKDRLIAEGKIKKDKPLAAIRGEEKPFELPVGWEWVRLGTVVNASEAGWSPSCISTPRRDGNWGVLKVSAVSWGKFDSAANKELPPDLQSKPEYEVKNGDFLLSRANTADLVARSVLVVKTEPKLMLSDKIIRLDISSQINRAFINLVNNSIFSRMHYAANSSGTSSSMKNVSREVVLALPVSLPPLAEQSRIVTRVEELMRLCDALEEKGRLEHTQHQQLLQALLDSLTQTQSAQELACHWQRLAQYFDLLIDRPEAVDALEQTILQLAVRGLLVEQDPSDEPASELYAKIQAERSGLAAAGLLKKIKQLAEPEIIVGRNGWVDVALGDLIELISGQHLGPSEYVEGLSDEIPYLTGPAEFGEKYPTPSRSTNERRSVSIMGDILITVKGSGVGKLNIVSQDEIAISRQLMAIRPLMVNSDFVYIFLETMGNFFQEKTVGIAIPGIGREDVNMAKIGLPPLAEQSRIVARVTELRALCQQLREKLTQARSTQTQLAQAWVEQAVT
ncbi:restriction endonuclease subunit S [Comamonas sp. Z3]|uniref:restriction endonuclease subunit S n=1 Tax=Comamonas sp. Z3 TaxID=2601247 RepID=UPI0011E75A32|nr:restriction endonuclease subunit S [Comamonas sp. Z3]TYK68924.1 restriction endonuclease subunit S [Comamonas sp. Z3]